PGTLGVHRMATSRVRRGPDGNHPRDELIGDLPGARASDLSHWDGDVEPGLSVAGLALGEFRTHALRLVGPPSGIVVLLMGSSGRKSGQTALHKIDRWDGSRRIPRTGASFRVNGNAKIPDRTRQS